jgi:hypothetical protein
MTFRRISHKPVSVAPSERWEDDRLKYNPSKLGSLAVIILGISDEVSH